jgi:hypothetical protein
MFLTFCSPIASKSNASFFSTSFATLPETQTPPWIGKLLKPSGDVDALAVPVCSLNDHLAEINADAHVDALVLKKVGVSLGHSALNGDRAFDCVDDAPELGKKPVTHELEDCAPMRGYRRLYQLNPVRLKALKGSRLVQLHQTAVADDVSGEDRGELAFHERAPFWPFTNT